MKRREFLTKGLKSYFSNLASSFVIEDSVNEQEQKDYFQSFFSCYPLLSEAPYDQLVATAKQLGINVEGKTKLEIAKEVFKERR